MKVVNLLEHTDSFVHKSKQMREIIIYHSMRMFQVDSLQLTVDFFYFEPFFLSFLNNFSHKIVGGSSCHGNFKQFSFK